MTDEQPVAPGLPGYPGRSAAFGHLMGLGYQSEGAVRTQAQTVEWLMQISDEELVLLGQVRTLVQVSLWQEALDAEISRRSIEAQRLGRAAIEGTTAALVAFRQESATSSSRLVTLTRWLIGFTVALALLTLALVGLTVALVLHDLGN